MKTIFKGKRISGILGILPEEISYFDDEVNNYNFPSKQTLRLKKVMGFDKHRLAKEPSTASQFCVAGLNYLLDNNLIKKNDIGAVVVVTLSPDYFVPHISNIVHGECNLDEEVLCMDVSQGCCGFLIGLIQSFMLLNTFTDDKKVLLFNTDVLSHKVSNSDRNEFPLIGDATTVTIVENDFDNAKDIYANIKTNGKDRNALIIPAGGFAVPSTIYTAKMKEVENGNFRSLDNLAMNGADIFNFVLGNVPSLMVSALKDCGIDKEQIDYYLFHQPNRFMLEKLAEELQIPYDRMFMNVVENFGNPSGASIPINIAFNMKQNVKKENLCCLSAFGSGLTWGVMIMQIGNMDFCELIESNL